MTTQSPSVTPTMEHFSEDVLYIRDGRTSQDYEVPITNNSIDARALRNIKPNTTGRSNTKSGNGLQVFDVGLQNTAVKKSEISSRDKATGLPIYRGYTTQDLWKCEYEELFFLMVFGHLPSALEKDILQRRLTDALQDIPDIVPQVIRRFPMNSLPQAMVLAGLSAWLSHVPQGIPALRGDTVYYKNPTLADKAVVKAAAAYAVVLGIVISHRRGAEWRPAESGRPFVENLFIMMGMVDPATKRPSPVVLDCFRRATILNADNGMTQSTFSMLVATSAGGDPLSCMVSAISAAYGPLHYGAQEATLQNLREIGHPDNVAPFLDKVKRKERRLFGYGHRALTIQDPRLTPVMAMLKELDVRPETNPYLRIANEIDRLAAQDEYFISRHLQANADFYTVFLFNGMGFDPEMIAVANMAQRMIGLLAHWRESVSQEIKLFRPLHVYVGPERALAEKARL